MWQCDHKFLDIFVWDGAGCAVKPVLTVVLDDYSRAVMGYYLDLDPPSAQRTAISLRQAIWHKGDPRWLVCGIPDHFYTDRGTDFRSLRIKQIAAELSIQRRKRRSGKPQGGGKIERFFLTVNQLLMSELPGYTSENAPPATPGMDIRQLQTLFDRWVIDEYMHKEHMRAKAIHRRSLRDDIKASVSFSDSCTDSQRKLPDVQTAEKAPVSKNHTRIRRYRVDE